MCRCYPIQKGGCQYPLKFGETTCRCKRRYDDIEIPNISIIENGYPQYRRQKNINISKRNELDLRVVSHNREIVMDWYGHANLEFVGAANVILYLYKYLFKGSKNKKMQVVNVKDKSFVNNQIVQYLSGRYLSAAQALWRIFKFQTYPKSSPSVCMVKICTVEELKNNAFFNKTTHMELYLRRPQKYELLTYLMFWTKMTYGTKLTKFALSDINRYYEPFLRKRTLNYYVFERMNKNNDQICRIGTVGFRSGEKFYLRLIMVNIAIPVLHSDLSLDSYFKNILTHNNITYKTYQECAVSHNIVDDYNILMDVFNDYQTLSGYNLRLLFIRQTYDGWPTKMIFELPFWRNLLLNGIPIDEDRYCSESDKASRLLQILDDMMYKNYNKRMFDYGFPKSDKEYTELSHHINKFDKVNHNEVSCELILDFFNHFDLCIFYNLCFIIRF